MKLLDYLRKVKSRDDLSDLSVLDRIEAVTDRLESLALQIQRELQRREEIREEQQRLNTR